MDVGRILRAAAWAAERHGDQKRKLSGVPYITHPLLVAAQVAEWGAEEDAIIAAILHDVLEDTPTDTQAIVDQFGSHVASLVQELTNDQPKDVRRAERTRRNKVRLQHASRTARLIKVADVIHNRSDLGLQQPEEWRRQYDEETRDLLAALMDSLYVR